MSVDFLAAAAERLEALNRPDDMHPIGCTDWVEEASYFLAYIAPRLLKEAMIRDHDES